MTLTATLQAGTTKAGARRVVGSVLVILATSLAGCDTISSSGPSNSAIVEQASTTPDQIDSYALIDIDATNIAHYRVNKPSDRGEATTALTQARVRLAPGDVLKVIVSESKEGGLFAPLATGGTTFPNVRIDQNGDISLPYVERLNVRGLDPQAVEAKIRAKLQGTAFEPQVYVELLANRNNSVLVAGEVRQPSRLSMLDGPMTVIDAVSRAGGLSRSALQSEAVIRRGGSVRRIPMSDVHNGRNMTLQAGDTVTIEPAVKTFNALGAVKKTGQIEFASAHPSIMDGLALANGLDDLAANPTGVFVIRLDEPHAYRDADGRWRRGSVVFRLDMRKPENLLLSQAMALKPGDTIYVTNAPAYEWLKIIRPIAASLVAVRSAVGVADQLDSLAD